MKLFTLFWLLVLAVWTTASLSADVYEWQSVAKAEPDECYNGFGQAYLDIDQCDNSGVPKRNHSYPWGMAHAAPRVWIGTGANMTHLARGAVGQGSPLDTPTVVAEYEASQYPGIPQVLRPLLGDWRPPRVWVYDTVTGEQINVTPEDPLLESTLGLRSVGANDGVVILAGPTLWTPGINLFAFDADSMEYLGSKTYWQYSNIRRWIVANGVMYVGVQNRLLSGGSIFRWRGSREDPFRFELVGLVDNDVANLAYHDGRLYAGTWAPSTLSSLASLFEFATNSGEPAAIWMSPAIPESGLRWWHIYGWQKIWDVTEYEPDEAIARAYGIGELVSFEGDLYWGTMNPPFSGFAALSISHGAPEDILAAQTNSNRAISVFRARLGGDSALPPLVELLYGEAKLPVYTPPSETDGESWDLVDNRMGGVEPLYGASGFDDPNNYYFWSTGVYGGALFVGLNEFVLERSGTTGADLWVFHDSVSPAELVDGSGLTSPLNEGFRGMVVTPEALYIGATNGANVSPEGGWELIRLQASEP